MPIVSVVPGVLGTSATDLVGIGDALGEARVGAAAATARVLTAAEDEVSTTIAALFSEYGHQFQILGGAGVGVS